MHRASAARLRWALPLWLLGGMAAGAPAVGEREHNLWPFTVRRADAAGNRFSWNGLGPLFFRQAERDGRVTSGLRPFWAQVNGEKGEFRAGEILYPLFSLRAGDDGHSWSILELIRGSEFRRGAAFADEVATVRRDFEIWPFWFFRRTGDPEQDYQGLFPLAGTIKNRLFHDRLSWTLFPLHVETERKGVVTTQTPWPIVKRTRGAARGFGVWPIYQWRERPGVSREEFFLWPLGYRITRQPGPDDPLGTAPRTEVGALPFFAQGTGPGYYNLDVIWPFFGRTERTEPAPYRENRFLWPFLVQGRGPYRYVNRLGAALHPFRDQGRLAGLAAAPPAALDGRQPRAHPHPAAVFSFLARRAVRRRCPRRFRRPPDPPLAAVQRLG